MNICQIIAHSIVAGAIACELPIVSIGPDKLEEFRGERPEEAGM